jgi:hypothetical protein
MYTEISNDDNQPHVLDEEWSQSDENTLKISANTTGPSSNIAFVRILDELT